MQFRLFKMRFRRRFRKSQREVEELGVQAEANLDRYFFRRLNNLGKVWRFVVAWVGLLLIIVCCQVAQLEGLSSHYQSLQPIPGGTYSEGILGRFTNANPLFATSEVDASVSRLVFSGLFTYSVHNHLIGDLAKSYTVDAKGTTYTVHLRPNLTWQDGQSLTADDVVYTYRTIQNPDVQSPLANSWQGVTVTKQNAYTVVFTLTNPLSAFPYTLTNGIVPQHLLAHYSAAELRSVDFNTVHPVGAGPFAWGALQVKSNDSNSSDVLIALKPNPNYHAGAPKLASFVVEAFSDQTQMQTAFRHQQVNAMIGLSDTPSELAKDTSVQVYSPLLTAANMTFFNNSSPVLTDTKVRQALVAGADTSEIIRQLPYLTRPVNEPFLTNQLGYDRQYAQAKHNPIQAATLLDQAGWVRGQDGYRAKANQRLQFSLYAADTTENRQVTDTLRKQWHDIGAMVNVHLQAADDLRNTIGSHDYDALLYGTAIGVDPDVFVYWDSSQTDPRSSQLNLSRYKSLAADTGLEAGRTRLDVQLRTVKYKPFLQAWQQDAPALGLYQPRMLYITHSKVYGFDQAVLNNATDRFNNVQNWQIRTAKVTD